MTAFPGMSSLRISLNDLPHVDQCRLLNDDMGICLLDSGGRRILIEGCRYRYVICLKDVKSLIPLYGFCMSGMILGCRIGGEELDFALNEQ